jgi:hypothetical protein
MIRRIAVVLALPFAMVLMTLAPAQAATTINAAAAPTGTHLQSGAIGCSVGSNQLVSCSTFELAGVGNANATATLSTVYSATVQCRNKGGQIVEVKSQVKAVPATTGKLSPKNGRLPVPALSSSPPTADQFKAMATCPNGNWTKEVLAGSLKLTSYTYTLHFAGYTGDYITITG